MFDNAVEEGTQTRRQSLYNMITLIIELRNLTALP